jgi:hypothetical protein
VQRPSCSTADLVSEGAPASTAPAVFLTVLAADRIRRRHPVKRNAHKGSGPGTLETSTGPQGHDRGWDALGRGTLPQCLPVLGWRHTHSPPKRAGEARLRGKLAIESNL